MKRFYLLLLLFGFFSGLQAQERSSTFSTSQETKTVRYYPNPAVSYINFDFQRVTEKNMQLQIINFLGRKVYEANVVSSKNMIVQLNDFYRGIYIFQLRDANGKLVDSGKFQVSK